MTFQLLMKVIIFPRNKLAVFGDDDDDDDDDDDALTQTDNLFTPI